MTPKPRPKTKHDCKTPRTCTRNCLMTNGTTEEVFFISSNICVVGMLEWGLFVHEDDAGHSPGCCLFGSQIRGEPAFVIPTPCHTIDIGVWIFTCRFQRTLALPSIEPTPKSLPGSGVCIQVPLALRVVAKPVPHPLLPHLSTCPW